MSTSSLMKEEEQECKHIPSDDGLDENNESTPTRAVAMSTGSHEPLPSQPLQAIFTASSHMSSPNALTRASLPFDSPIFQNEPSFSDNSHYAVPWLFMDPFYPSLYESSHDLSPLLSDSPGFIHPSDLTSHGPLSAVDVSDYDSIGSPMSFNESLNMYNLTSTVGSVDEKKVSGDDFEPIETASDHAARTSRKRPSSVAVRVRGKPSRLSIGSVQQSRKRLSSDKILDSDVVSAHPTTHPTIIEFIQHNDQFTTSERNLGIRSRKMQSSKKEMKEMEAVCSSCGNKFATLILHGPPETLDSNYDVHVECHVCLEASQSLDSSPNPSKTRPHKIGKRSHKSTSDDVLECDSCRRWLGHIDMKLWNPSRPCFKPGMESIDAEKRCMEIQDVLSDFGVEVVCEACAHKYGFCTECGGGRRFRTGKWRVQ